MNLDQNQIYFPTVAVPCRYQDGTEKTVTIRFDPPSYLDIEEMNNRALIAGRKAGRVFLKSKGVENPAAFKQTDNPDLWDEAWIVTNRAELLHKLQFVAGRLKGWDLKELHDNELTQTLSWESLAKSGPVVYLAIESTVCQFSQGKQADDDKKKPALPPASASSNPTSADPV